MESANLVDIPSMGPVPEPVQGTATGTINDMMVCGFNESHVMSVGHYHMHSRKCRVTRGGVEPLHRGVMKICPFNASHHIHSSVYNKHIEMCDDYYKHCQEIQEDPPTKAEREAIKKGEKRAARRTPRARRADEESHTSHTSFDTETETDRDAAETDTGETDAADINTDAADLDTTIDATETDFETNYAGDIDTTEADTNESDTSF